MSRLQGLLSWAAQKEDTRSARPTLEIELPCFRCSSGKLAEDPAHRKKSHILRCIERSCDEAVELTYCRYCTYSPLVKRSRLDAMVYGAKAAGSEFTNARCPACESYL